MSVQSQKFVVQARMRAAQLHAEKSRPIHVVHILFCSQTQQCTDPSALIGDLATRGFGARVPGHGGDLHVEGKDVLSFMAGYTYVLQV